MEVIIVFSFELHIDKETSQGQGLVKRERKRVVVSKISTS